MHSRVARVPFLAAVIGTLAILAAGCASSGTSAGTAAALSAQQAIELAAKNSTTLDSFTATVSLQGSTPAGGGGFTETIKARLHPSLFAEADIGKATITLSPPGLQTEIITPKAIYLRSRSLTQSGHISKPWAEIPLTGITGTAVSQLMNQLQTASPVTLTQLIGSSKTVRKVGTTVIDGVPVTEYAGSFTMRQALAALPAGTRSAIEGQIANSEITMATFKIWLDAQHDPRQVTVTEYGGPLSLTVTETITSINQPVNIQLPPASETSVAPASQLSS